MLEFGAEKGLLQGQVRRTGGLCSKTPNSLLVLTGKIWGEGCRVCDFLLIGGEVIGQCSRTLVLSLKLPAST